MTKSLLAINGAQYSLDAVKKAIRLTKAKNLELDILYANPPCNQIYPGAPDLCFWMQKSEYKQIAGRLRRKVMEEQIKPIIREYDLEPNVIITNLELDEKIKEVSDEHNYEQIFIASPSKYCQKETRSWFNFGSTTHKIPQGTVCLI